MTDNEIIKAYEICHNIIDGGCVDCPYEKDDFCIKHSTADLFVLINRQKAEIERLETELKAMQSVNRFNKEEIERLGRLGASATRRLIKARAEAIKEFAERVKQKTLAMVWSPDELSTDDYIECIDNLVKEMVGDGNGCTDVFGAAGKSEGHHTEQAD